MPTRLDTNFAPLTNPDEFESLIRDLCVHEWCDPNTRKFGRKGQKQYGVDVYGQPVDLEGKYRAAQCKLRTSGDNLTESEIEKEVADAKNFPHPLDTLVIVTDAPRDTHTQVTIDNINDREVQNGSFHVVIWFWNEITERLSAYPKLIVRYYRDYFANLTTLPIIEKLGNTPLKILSIRADSTSISLINDLLWLRGIRVMSESSFSTNSLNDLLPDGVVGHYNMVESGSTSSKLLKFATDIRACAEQVERTCPLVVIAPSSLHGEFLDCYKSVGGDHGRLRIFAGDLPPNQIADDIFLSVFEFGYSRRGGLATIDVTARTHVSQAVSCLLDMNWHAGLNSSLFPTPSQWEDIFLPALQVVTRRLIGLGNGVRIQVASYMPVPAALALGYHVNIRVSRVGVWARSAGVSDFRQQFWLSDGQSAGDVVAVEQLRPSIDANNSAIVELTTGVSIHKSVERFVSDSQITAGAWLELKLNSPVTNLTESLAVAYADAVGSTIRGLTAEGITDTHIFARIPSALGVLVGQRLQACGLIHLYWFDNPTYRYAFTLK